MDEKEQSRRKAYGRGVFDGLQMAGITNPGEFMNQQKLERVEQGINGIAKKVLECCPFQEPWTKEEIAREMRRIGSNAQINVIQGCLDTLRGTGLIKEPERGKFIRVAAKPKEESKPPLVLIKGEPMPAEKEKTVQIVVDPLSRMAELAEQARAIAKDIEAVALDMEMRMERVEKETEKLRQLQSLLKSLN